MSITPMPQSLDHTASAPAFRLPEVDDGARLWQMVAASKALDVNSPYAYLMWCDYFAKTSVVVEVRGSLAGFLLGFSPPDQPDSLFVWQVAVDAKYRGRGLASSMLDRLIERVRPRAVLATVTPSNHSSQELFRSLARRHDCVCSERDHFEREHFPGQSHEPEQLFHIGPITYSAGATE